MTPCTASPCHTLRDGAGLPTLAIRKLGRFPYPGSSTSPRSNRSGGEHVPSAGWRGYGTAVEARSPSKGTTVDPDLIVGVDRTSAAAARVAEE